MLKTSPEWSCVEGEVGFSNLYGSLPTWEILFFCDSTKFFTHNHFGSCNTQHGQEPIHITREDSNFLNKYIPMPQSFKCWSRESHQRQSNARTCVYERLGTKLPHLLQTKTGISLLVGGKMRAHLDFFHPKIEGEISRKQTYAWSHTGRWASRISTGMEFPVLGQAWLQRMNHCLQGCPAGIASKWWWPCRRAMVSAWHWFAISWVWGIQSGWTGR